MAGDVPAADEDLGLRAALERRLTLPAHWYTDPDVYELEKKRIFNRSWQYVGRADQVEKRGSFFTCMLGDVPVLVLRDGDGELRSFANVCRHRGCQVVLDDKGTRQTIQCHYHGWTWNLDGTLRTVPRWNEQPNFNKEEFPLFPLKLRSWGPFVFVNPDPQAGPFDAMTGDLPTMVSDLGLELDAVRYRTRIEYDVACNWKTFVENFLECYHCPVPHPSFSDMIDIDNYKIVTEHKYYATQHGSVRESAGEGKGDGLYDVSNDVLNNGVREGLYSLLWPSFMFAIQPGPANISTLRMEPDGPFRTRVYFDFFFADNVTDAEANEVVKFLDQVLKEDLLLCESVQRGLRSGYYNQGQLIVSRENGLQHFQKLVREALGDA